MIPPDGRIQRNSPGRQKPPRRITLSTIWMIGTIQYCVVLFVAGVAWLLAALRTGFFWDDPALQAASLLLLGAVIAVEAAWAHMPGEERRR